MFYFISSTFLYHSLLYSGHQATIINLFKEKKKKIDVFLFNTHQRSSRSRFTVSSVKFWKVISKLWMWATILHRSQDQQKWLKPCLRPSPVGWQLHRSMFLQRFNFHLVVLYVGAMVLVNMFLLDSKVRSCFLTNTKMSMEAASVWAEPLSFTEGRPTCFCIYLYFLKLVLDWNPESHWYSLIVHPWIPRRYSQADALKYVGIEREIDVVWLSNLPPFLPTMHLSSLKTTFL